MGLILSHQEAPTTQKEYEHDHIQRSNQQRHHTTKRHTDMNTSIKMQEFIESGASRETDHEIMTAIAGCAVDVESASRIWESPSAAELAAIIEAVTCGDRLDTTDFCWGVYGSSWASEL